MRHNWRVIQGAPCPKNLAPYVAIVVNDARATVNSIYRGQDAEGILNRYGKHSQRQLYQLYLDGRGNPANPPGFSTHEQKSDGAAYNVPRGHDLVWWQIGFDVNDGDVNRVIRAAARYGWQLWRPYPAGSELHHVNFARQPRPTPRTFLRIVRLRRSLPRR